MRSRRRTRPSAARSCELELAAQVATLQAEADAMRADDMVEGITESGRAGRRPGRRRHRAVDDVAIDATGVAAAAAEPDTSEDAPAST